MKERVRSGPGPPHMFAMLAFVCWGIRSAQTDSVLSWLSLGVALGATAGASSLLRHCTSSMARPPEPAAVGGSVAGQHPVSRDEDKARFQEAAFAIRRQRGKESAVVNGGS